MGYHTRYSLEVDSEYRHEIIELLLAKVDFARTVLQPNGKSTGEFASWHKHDIDLIKLSKKFPEVLFTLSGEGEDSNDMWKLYVLGGKSYKQKAVIFIPAFDKSKLQ